MPNYPFPFKNNYLSGQIKPADSVFFCLIQPSKLVLMFSFFMLCPAPIFDPLITGFSVTCSDFQNNPAAAK